jgi:hypothetical protein
MSIAPCQVCGGTGFINAPIDDRTTPQQEGEQATFDGAADEAGIEKIPCPVCSGSGANTGV